MRRAQTRLAGLAVLALAGAVSARGDPPKADDPDPGFLEFLGSVDRLSEVNPDYLSQANPARTARPVQPGAPPPRRRSRRSRNRLRLRGRHRGHPDDPARTQ